MLKRVEQGVSWLTKLYEERRWVFVTLLIIFLVFLALALIAFFLVSFVLAAQDEEAVANLDSSRDDALSAFSAHIAISEERGLSAMVKTWNQHSSQPTSFAQTLQEQYAITDTKLEDRPDIQNKINEIRYRYNTSYSSYKEVMAAYTEITDALHREIDDLPSFDDRDVQRSIQTFGKFDLYRDSYIYVSDLVLVHSISHSLNATEYDELLFEIGQRDQYLYIVNALLDEDEYFDLNKNILKLASWEDGEGYIKQILAIYTTTTGKNSSNIDLDDAWDTYAINIERLEAYQTVLGNSIFSASSNAGDSATNILVVNTIGLFIVIIAAAFLIGKAVYSFVQTRIKFRKIKNMSNTKTLTLD
jgi:hypothetical protein